jgi:hypothetical protein
VGSLTSHNPIGLQGTGIALLFFYMVYLRFVSQVACCGYVNDILDDEIFTVYVAFNVANVFPPLVTADFVKIRYDRTKVKLL